ncbi:epidermal growth factor receptor kinase substrate 8-like protein 3 isoform X2 [Monodelphis domestica]|nr:epidermal growth factor receptor kinase substrate 8-like protein 3 isoform X2 [Monodelphis domestica]
MSAYDNKAFKDIGKDPAVTTSIDYKSQSSQGFSKISQTWQLNKIFQIQNQLPTREMEILTYVISDIDTFVGEVEKVISKTKPTGPPFTAWLPAPQYIDYFQKIKYAFNLLGKITCLNESSIHGLILNLFNTLEFVTCHCPDGENLPIKVNCPLLTPEAIQLLKKSNIYLENFGDAWTKTRADYKPEPPAYTPSFYDGWQLPPPS